MSECFDTILEAFDPNRRYYFTLHDGYNFCMHAIITSAVLRLECSLVCISGSVGHQQNIFRSFSHCQRFFGKKNVIIKNVIGSVGHHQFYIHWSSAGTHHTYKLSRESVNVL